MKAEEEEVADQNLFRKIIGSQDVHRTHVHAPLPSLFHAERWETGCSHFHLLCHDLLEALATMANDVPHGTKPCRRHDPAVVKLHELLPYPKPESDQDDRLDPGSSHQEGESKEQGRGDVDRRTHSSKGHTDGPTNPKLLRLGLGVGGVRITLPEDRRKEGLDALPGRAQLKQHGLPPWTVRPSQSGPSHPRAGSEGR